jgi:O-antigen/teichoic acid export membrane protein
MGQVIYLGCQWSLMLMFARHGGASAAGLYALGLAISAPVMVMANLHLRELHASDVRQEFSFQERLAVRLVALGCAVSAISTAVWWTSWSHLEAWSIIAVTGAKAVESLADLGYGAFQARERFVAIAQAQVLRGLTGALVATTTYLFTHDVPIALVSLATSWLVIILLVDVPRLVGLLTPEGIRPRITLTRFRALLRQAAPMGLVTGIGSLTLMFPSFALQHHAGTTELGQYSAMLHLLMIGTVASIALGQASSPRVARAHTQGDRIGFCRIILVVCAGSLLLGAAAILLIWLLGGEILALAYGQEWRSLTNQFWWMACSAATLWVTAVIGYASTATRRLLPQVPIAILACIVSGVVSWWLVPSHGMVGAAWSSMVTCGFLFVSHLMLVGSAWQTMGRSTS